MPIPHSEAPFCSWRAPSATQPLLHHITRFIILDVFCQKYKKKVPGGKKDSKRKNWLQTPVLRDGTGTATKNKNSNTKLGTPLHPTSPRNKRTPPGVCMDLEEEDEEAALCTTCSQIGWDAVLGGTLTDSAREMFSMRHLYKLDGTDGTGAPFLRGPVVSIAALTKTPPECPLCRLWLRSYRRVYPDRDPANDTRGAKDSWFIYHVGESDYGEQWRGNPRGTDDDTQSWTTRKKAMQAFRLRFRRYEDIRNFESELELTCLDAHLPSENRSRGGRLLADDGCPPERLQEWMRLCQAEHGNQCDSDVPLTNQEIKLRLIDVDTLRVVVRTFDEPYCALSYVWGPLISFRAETKYFEPDPEQPDEVFLDLQPFLTKKGTEVVPATVVDAIEVTRRLGQRYLWVDAICIMKEPQESAHSISAMDIIYKKAVLTIVAAAGSDCTAGLPRAHPGAPKLLQITERVAGRMFMLAQPSLNVVLKHAVWSTRAWTFQETKLSSRQLIFSDSGVYFRCQGDTWAEDAIEKIIPRNRLSRMTRAGRVMYASRPSTNNKEAVFADYTYDVRSYTARTLGRQSDALNAFMGLIADMKQTKLKTPFPWGLPRSYMDAALLWKGVDGWMFQFWSYRPVKEGLPERQRRNKVRAASRGYTWMDESETPTTLQRRPGFPSWSWCGWQGHTGYFPRTTTQPDLSLLKSIRGRVKWPWDSPDEDWGEEDWSGALKNGCLTFRAWRALVDFDKLPYGSLPKDNDRKAWMGWPMDGEPPLLHGEHECILLSRQLRHPVAFSGLMFEHYRTLDPVGKTFLVNVMVIGRDGDKEHRRGIGMMREDIWWRFEPKWSLVRLY